MLRRRFVSLSAGLYLLIGSIMMSSCGSYKQNILFKVPEGSTLQTQLTAAEKNYIVQKNDLLQLEVYTNKGERLVDPEAVLSKDQGATPPEPKTYLVDESGKSKFPLIDEEKIEGLTLRQAEALLQGDYGKFYQDPFVILKYANKRVTVLGSPGGQVIPLTNENMRLTEVLALAKGLNNDAKAHNIRVIRGDQIMLADLSTFEGYKKNDVIVAPGDIIYVEPIRRPLSEGLRDYGPAISIITSLTTLIVVIISL
jgi:polysaccharide export outer membrane protein